jgi:type IV pilus assembly protein PilO
MAQFRMPQTQREQVMTVLAVLGLAAAPLYWYLAYAPKTVELDAKQVRVDSLDANNQRAKAELAKGSVNELREQAKAYTDNLQLMRQLVPAGNELPVLLEQVSTSARRVGLDIGAIEPLGVQQGDTFDSYRYRLRLQGPYHVIADFLTSVASLTRVITPTNVTLSANEQAAQQPPRAGQLPRTVTAQFELETFVARTAAAAAPAAPASGGPQ